MSDQDYERPLQDMKRLNSLIYPPTPNLWHIKCKVNPLKLYSASLTCVNAVAWHLRRIRTARWCYFIRCPFRSSRPVELRNIRFHSVKSGSFYTNELSLRVWLFKMMIRLLYSDLSVLCIVLYIKFLRS